MVILRAIWWLLDPVTLVPLLCLVGGGLWRLGRAAWGKRLLFAGVFAFFFLGVIPVGRMLAASLESRFAIPPSIPSDVVGILTLVGEGARLMVQLYGVPS